MHSVLVVVLPHPSRLKQTSWTSQPLSNATANTWSDEAWKLYRQVLELNPPGGGMIVLGENGAVLGSTAAGMSLAEGLEAQSKWIWNNSPPSTSLPPLETAWKLSETLKNASREAGKLFQSTGGRKRGLAAADGGGSGSGETMRSVSVVVLAPDAISLVSETAPTPVVHALPELSRVASEAGRLGRNTRLVSHVIGLVPSSHHGTIPEKSRTHPGVSLALVHSISAAVAVLRSAGRGAVGMAHLTVSGWSVEVGGKNRGPVEWGFGFLAGGGCPTRVGRDRLSRLPLSGNSLLSTSRISCVHYMTVDVPDDPGISAMLSVLHNQPEAVIALGGSDGAACAALFANASGKLMMACLGANGGLDDGVVTGGLDDRENENVGSLKPSVHGELRGPAASIRAFLSGLRVAPIRAPNQPGILSDIVWLGHRGLIPAPERIEHASRAVVASYAAQTGGKAEPPHFTSAAAPIRAVLTSPVEPTREQLGEARVALGPICQEAPGGPVWSELVAASYLRGQTSIMDETTRLTTGHPNAEGMTNRAGQVMSNVSAMTGALEVERRRWVGVSKSGGVASGGVRKREKNAGSFLAAWTRACGSLVPHGATPLYGTVPGTKWIRREARPDFDAGRGGRSGRGGRGRGRGGYRGGRGEGRGGRGRGRGGRGGYQGGSNSGNGSSSGGGGGSWFDGGGGGGGGSGGGRSRQQVTYD